MNPNYFYFEKQFGLGYISMNSFSRNTLGNEAIYNLLNYFLLKKLLGQLSDIRFI